MDFCTFALPLFRTYDDSIKTRIETDLKDVSFEEVLKAGKAYYEKKHQKQFPWAIALLPGCRTDLHLMFSGC
jgi:hypothetical protein